VVDEILESLDLYVFSCVTKAKKKKPESQHSLYVKVGQMTVRPHLLHMNRIEQDLGNPHAFVRILLTASPFKLQGFSGRRPEFPGLRT